jgi:hypothetical protein
MVRLKIVRLKQGNYQAIIYLKLYSHNGYLKNYKYPHVWN